MAIREILRGQDAIVMVSSADLREFANSLINEAKLLDREEVMYTAKDFAQKHNVAIGTLWRWEKAGILKKTMIGGRAYYRESGLKKV